MDTSDLVARTSPSRPRSRAKFNYRALTAVFLALLLVVFSTSQASAHANLLSSDPADGSMLDEAPQEVRLWFDEPISAKFSSAQLFDANSQPVQIKGARADAADPTMLIIELPELPDGTYSILWKVLSETDGHLNQGLLVYGIGQGSEADMSAVVAPQAQAPPLIEVFLRWFNFTLLAGLVGAAAMVQLILEPAAGRRSADPQEGLILARAGQRVIVWAIVCTGLGLFVGLGLLLYQSFILMQTFSAGAAFLDVSRQILTQTRWGILWLARQTLLLFTCGLLLFINRLYKGTESGRMLQWDAQFKTGGWLLVDFLLLTILTLQSLNSHAAGLRINITLALVADVLHLLAASLWVGGLLALAIGLLPLIWRNRAQATNLIYAGWRPFSLIAVLSVGMLAATGLYSAGRQVATPDALLTTLYGQALLGKNSLVTAVGFFGLLNSMLLHPRLARPLTRLLRRPAGWTPLPLNRFPLLVMAEITVGLLVMLATGLVTASEAPRGTEFTLAAEDIPGSLSQIVDDVVITLSTKPNRPGQNVFTVFARSTRRPAPAGIARVILRFTYLDQESGRVSADAEEVEPGRFLLTGNYLSLAGNWQVDVVVRRLGLEDSVAHFDWIVAPPGEARPVFVSNYALEPVLTLAAAGLLLLMLLVIGFIQVSQQKNPLGHYFQKRQKTLKAEIISVEEVNDEDSQRSTAEDCVVYNDDSTPVYRFAAWFTNGRRINVRGTRLSALFRR